jgi:hypothetical protein
MYWTILTSSQKSYRNRQIKNIVFAGIPNDFNVIIASACFDEKETMSNSFCTTFLLKRKIFNKFFSLANSILSHHIF